MDKELLERLYEGMGKKNMEAMPDGPEKAMQYASDGLFIDGDHHKQWHLERVLMALGVDLDELKKRNQTPDEDGDTYEWEEGVAP